MNRRLLTAAFAALLIPASAAAQMQPLQEEETRPTLRVTPFIGTLTGFDRVEEWQTSGTQRRFVSVSNRVARGNAVGLNVELPLSGRFGVTGAGAFASRDRSLLVLQTGDVYVMDGNNVFLGRLGAVLHLREEPSEFVMRRMGASVFAGGVVMHERPLNTLGTADFVSPGTHFGINVGLNAELPFKADRLAVQVGIEDNMMWWRDSPMVGVASDYFGSPSTQTTVSSDMTHTWLLRAGLSLRTH